MYRLLRFIRFFKFKTLRYRNVKQFNKIPITAKEEIQKNYPDKIASQNINFEKCKVVSTTGSTGMPLKVLYRSKELSYLGALFNYFYSEAGVNWNNQIIVIRHFPTSLKNRLKR